MKVSVVGPVNVDVFVRGSAPLDRDALHEWVDTCEVDLLTAGSVGYTVDVLTRLGVHVDLHTTLASDAFGEIVHRDLLDRGIDVANVTQAEGLTGLALYLLLFESSKRPLAIRFPTIEPWPDPPPVELDHDPPDAVLSGGLLHFPAMWHRGLAPLFERARGQGITTVLDPQFPLEPTPPPWLPHVADVAAHTDTLLIDDLEGRNLFEVDEPERMVQAAHDLGCGVVAVKRGPNGAVLSDGTRMIHQPAVPLSAEETAESVGAGDAFDAGLVTALLSGVDLVEAAGRATATAAVTLAGVGGSATVTPEAVEEMRARVPDPVER